MPTPSPDDEALQRICEEVEAEFNVDLSGLALGATKAVARRYAATVGAGVPEETRKVLRDLLNEHDKNVCTHDETHRGGSIWTICAHCGRKWADDEGGFQPYQGPPAVTAAWSLLKCEEVTEPAQSAPAFRVGRKVPRNVYEGNRPLFMAATAEEAARLVALLNAAPSSP